MIAATHVLTSCASSEHNVVMVLLDMRRARYCGYLALTKSLTYHEAHANCNNFRSMEASYFPCSTGGHISMHDGALCIGENAGPSLVRTGVHGVLTASLHMYQLILH